MVDIFSAIHFHSLCSLSIDKKKSEPKRTSNQIQTKYIYLYIERTNFSWKLFRRSQHAIHCIELGRFFLLFQFTLFCEYFLLSFLRSLRVVFSSSFFFWVVVAFFRNFEAWRECANARYQLHCGESIRSVVFNHGTQITFRPFGCCCFFPHVFVWLYSRSTENTHSNGFEFHRVGHSFRFPFSFIRRPKPNANKRLIHRTQKKLTLYTIK